MYRLPLWDRIRRKSSFSLFVSFSLSKMFLLAFVLSSLVASTRAGQINGTEKSMARHWHEQLLTMSHLASGDPTTHSRDFFHLGVVMWEVWRIFNATGADSIIGTSFLPKVVTPAQKRQLARRALRFSPPRAGRGSQRKSSAISRWR
jgi:hypothetical protein